VSFRRRILGRGERATARIDVTNFIDIVLILLIFLVATSTFVSESAVAVERPRSSRAEETAEAFVTVAVTAAGAVHCAGEPVALAALPDAVARALRDRGAARVVVLSDRQAQVGLTLRVMDLCRDGGAKRVDLAAERELAEAER
jgi:biopolymer transport protein ExbD